MQVREKSNSAHVRADDDFHHNKSMSGTLDRGRRATSVQRQTDTLRRLAHQRDVTPRLQTPAPGTAAYVAPPITQQEDLHHHHQLHAPNITTNPNYGEGGIVADLLGEDVDDLANSEVGGPVILLSDDGAYSLR